MFTRPTRFGVWRWAGIVGFVAASAEAAWSFRGRGRERERERERARERERETERERERDKGHPTQSLVTYCPEV